MHIIYIKKTIIKVDQRPRNPALYPAMFGQKWFCFVAIQNGNIEVNWLMTRRLKALMQRVLHIPHANMKADKSLKGCARKILNFCYPTEEEKFSRDNYKLKIYNLQLVTLADHDLINFSQFISAVVEYTCACTIRACVSRSRLCKYEVTQKAQS